MIAVVTSATQAATVGTEHTLTTQTTPATYVLVVDANALASGEMLELRIYTKVLSGSTSRPAYYALFTGPMTDASGGANLYSIPVPTTHEFKATLKQTSGTGRSFDWEVLTL